MRSGSAITRSRTREGALGRLDQPVDVIEAFALRDAQALEQRENHQRREALGRRRAVERGAGIEPGRQRLGERGAAAGEVGTRDRAADAREVAGDLASDVAAVEIVEPGMGEMIQRRGQRRLPERLAGIGRLAVDQECRREAGRVLELGELFRREAGLTAADDVAAARVADRRGQQFGQRQTPAVRASATSSASIQPATAPGTVSAASGPRGGIASTSR